MHDDATLDERELLQRALELPPAERAAFLRERSRGDERLCERVERLIAAHERAAAFTGEQASLAARPEVDAVGGSIGPYRLVEKLGEGGMGVVFLAEQSAPIRREVALKVIKLGMDTGQVVARFEAERQTLALMDHPGIARVFDAGATAQGRPYFVMELVRGAPITEHCDAAQLATRARLELFEQVCDAVQHAHVKGVIHRDLKPSNVLVTRDAPPRPKVIDFGIAKATEGRASGSLLTVENQVLGTPEYMAPEQALASGDVDTRSDVYSLGVLLYELLTGSRPFDLVGPGGAKLQALLRQIAEDDPRPPSTRVRAETDASRAAARARGTQRRLLFREIRGDLDWVVLKAMEKDRERRYESVGALAADVRRYLEDRPVEAGPPSALYRAYKFARRNKAWVGAGAVALVALTAGIGSLFWSLAAVRVERDDAVAAREAEKLAKLATEAALEDAEAARALAEDERDQANEVTTFLTDMLVAVRPGESGRDVRVGALLRQAEGKLERDLAERPLVRARLAETLGVTYDALGEYDRAIGLLEQAYALRRERRGPDDRGTLGAQTELGVAYWRAGRLAEAEEVLRDNLERARRTVGPDDRLTISVEGNLIIVVRALGRQAEAETMALEAIEKARELFGPTDPDTLNLIQNLVVSYVTDRRYDEAEALMRDLFEVRDRESRERPLYLALLVYQARLEAFRGRPEQAEALYREVLAARERVLGEYHPETLNSVQDLAYFLFERARYDEAEPLFRDAIERKRDVLGSDHTTTLSALRAFGLLLWRRGDLAEAQALFEEVRTAYVSQLGDRHPRVVDVTNLLAIVHYAQSHHSEAAALWSAQLEAEVAQKGADHRDTIVPRVNLGMVYSDLGRFTEAERHYREGLALCLSLYGPENDWTLNTQNNLAVLLQHQRRYDEAAELNAVVIQVRDRTLGPKHPDTIGTKNNLITCLQLSGRIDEAWARLGTLHDECLATLGPDHKVTLSCVYTRGVLLWKRRDYEGARVELEAALQGRKRVLGEEHIETLRTLRTLGLLARDAGDLAAARGLLERVALAQTALLGAENGERLETLVSLAEVLRADGDPAGAHELEASVREAHLARAADVGADASARLTTAAYLLQEGGQEEQRAGDAALALELVQRVRAERADLDPEVQELLARCHRALGNSAHARAILVETLDALPAGDARRVPLEVRLASWADG